VKILILDINLGDGSGFEICRNIRSTNDDIPIIFLSARTDDQDQVLALTIGGDDYIVKPYSLPVLTTKVKKILKRLKRKKLTTQVKLFIKMIPSA